MATQSWKRETPDAAAIVQALSEMALARNATG
jgi:hypothetical protein